MTLNKFGQEVDKKESLLSEAEELKKSVLEELRKTREELKAERDKWHQENEALKQVTHVHVTNIA